MTTMDRTAPYSRLVADVGGTQARFGWVRQPGGSVAQVASYACSEHAGPEAVIARYLAEQALTAPASCAIAIATSTVADTVSMTNRDWTLSVSELRRRLGLERLVVLNDFAALALALPALVPDELSKVGGGQAVGDAPVALIGPGTGLGVSALVSAHAVSLPIAGEGGHVTIGAADAGEDRIVSCLRGWFGHVSAERVLSVGGWIARSRFRERFESKGRCGP